MGNFGCGEGGWTPVMKIDGSKQTFHYDSNYWSNKVGVNPDGGKVGFDSNESKLPTYWNTPFSRICLGMKIGEAMNFIVIQKQAESLHSLIADGLFRPTSLGRNAWKSLIGSQGSLQLKCNKEGFNAYNVVSRARIGIIANNNNDCLTPDSRIGFGTGGSHGHSNTCGNAARLYADNGDINLMSMCYILVM
ncbi:PREDICTED: uncharacterized skeletal organic matrix protein 5-like [Acropora digitifera]|uniref:uncharacterized skeletal organic matrix protein 5-like n=1 Tax=Acropora digitifera TaxID=70779 RepID=UPI00077A3405|nr:PREDICTED: uncharacterized skeletal organic matrix protein 5-like [Acropora digitifera]